MIQVPRRVCELMLLLSAHSDTDLCTAVLLQNIMSVPYLKSSNVAIYVFFLEMKLMKNWSVVIT